MVMIDSPERRRWPSRGSAGLVAAAGAPGARVLGIEVTQTIQNMAHDVRLIAGKTVVARVYLDPEGLSADLKVRGEIVAAQGQGTPGLYVASSNELTLQALGQPALDAQRRDAVHSLNFLLRLPPAGTVSFRLNRLFVTSDGAEFPILNADHTVEVAFETAPVLRIRVLGLRYEDRSTNPPERFAPDPIHFDHLRSFLTRTYPGGGIDWSQAVVDAPAGFMPPFNGTVVNGRDPLWEALLTLLHQHMMTIRAADMNVGWDPRTHYYGLVSDASGFFRGAANDVPTRPAPNTVAVGPCGEPSNTSLSWDDDGSYGDWYGAHELAHTFGRFHPGFCRQDRSDIDFPHPGGAISGAGEDCIGFDVGDADLNLPMRAYPRENWVDFMTYCDRQWISRYTYDALYARLVAEDAAFAPPIA